MPQNEAMHLLLTFFFTVFGSLLGSFSNVVILRMAGGKSVIFPPSACPVCNHQLHAGDLIPVFSWLLLRGKCRYCKAPISYQYPLVEATIAAIVGLSFFSRSYGPEFVILASRMVIWFIASVIFLRQEVRKPQPFLWAIFYFLALDLIAGKYPIIYHSAFAPALIASFIAFVATRKSESYELFSWGSLSFLFLLNTLGYFWVFAAFPPLLLAVLNNLEKTRQAARLLFFVLMLFGIFLKLLP